MEGRREGVPPGTGTAIALAGVAAATVAFGLIADAAGTSLGTENPPFFLTWDPAAISAAFLWGLLLVAAVACALPLVRGAGGPATFLVSITLLAAASRLALAALRDGPVGWYSVFGTDPEAANEYLPALPALHNLGPLDFLDRFAELSLSLPIHPSSHPPGLLLLLDGLGIGGARGFAALVIAGGLAVIPLTWWTARRFEMTDAQARVAAALLAFSPGAMIYGVASADALFASAGLLAVALLAGRSLGSRIAGGAALAVASFLSWALLAVGAYAALLAALREGLAAGIRTAAIAGIAVLVFLGGLHLLTGYDPFGVLEAANAAYELGIASARPWEFWVLGSPVAFFCALGLPISWYAARALGAGEEVAIALAIVVVIAAVLGFSKAETERIWLFLAPLACVAAAAIAPRERLPVVFSLLVAQAVAVELTMETVW